MGLAEDLSDVALAFECQECSHPTARKGSVLRTIAFIRCEGCNAKVRITYPQKVAIFEKHKLLAAKGALQLLLAAKGAEALLHSFGCFADITMSV